MFIHLDVYLSHCACSRDFSEDNKELHSMLIDNKMLKSEIECLKSEEENLVNDIKICIE